MARQVNTWDAMEGDCYVIRDSKGIVHTIPSDRFPDVIKRMAIVLIRKSKEKGDGKRNAGS